ncbi:MAG: SDR family oxidoreductase [Bacillota bacterium]|nr:SDR family oxidoreductase [Bacillota bacterium]
MESVLITGGAKGIGEATARLFYQKGYKVIINYFHSEKEALTLVKELPGITAIKADVSDPEAVKSMFLEAGPVDILVNNSGCGGSCLFTDITDAEFDRVMKVNLYGTFYCCREALPYMINKKSGKIINVSSIWGITGGSMETHYSAAKAGIIGLTKALAKEVGPSGICVNSIAPGYIETDMNSHLSRSDKESFFEDTPLFRGGTPLEIAKAVYFLASHDADFITGQILSPNGGYVI